MAQRDLAAQLTYYTFRPFSSAWVSSIMTENCYLQRQSEKVLRLPFTISDPMLVCIFHVRLHASLIHNHQHKETADNVGSFRTAA